MCIISSTWWYCTNFKAHVRRKDIVYCHLTHLRCVTIPVYVKHSLYGEASFFHIFCGNKMMCKSNNSKIIQKNVCICDLNGRFLYTIYKKTFIYSANKIIKINFNTFRVQFWPSYAIILSHFTAHLWWFTPPQGELSWTSVWQSSSTSSGIFVCMRHQYIFKKNFLFHLFCVALFFCVRECVYALWQLTLKLLSSCRVFI